MLTGESEKMEMNDYILEVEDLSVIRSGKLVISDINLKIARGEFVGIVGPNGSGKTTLLLSILGILKANTGKIRFTAASRCPGKMMGEYLGFSSSIKYS